MTGEQTLVSKILSPIVNGSKWGDVFLLAGSILVIAGYITSEISPILGSAVVLFYLAIRRIKANMGGGNYRKFGLYNVVETGEDMNEGYTVLYAFGYEIARKLDFQVESESERGQEIEAIQDME